MAPNARFVYEFALDAATAEATAQRLAQIYQQSLAQVKVPALQMDSAAGQAMVAQARAQQAQITADTRAQANERSASARAEAAVRAQEARSAASQVIEAEKRLTAETKAEIRQREMAQQQASRGGLGGGLISGGAGGGISGLLGTTIAGVGIGYAARQGLQFMAEADQIATSYKRQSVAALEMAGSQEKVNQLMRAYDQATGGAVSKANELAQVTKLQTLGFADSTKELTRFVSGARGASLATGRDADYVVGQAQLAIANQSTMRLDQIGVGVEEFKNKLKEVTEANKGFSDSALYQETLLEIWEQKFGALTTSAAGAATGMERLSKAWDDFKLAAGQSDWFNEAAGTAANLLTYVSGSDEDRLKIAAPKNITRARGRIQDAQGGPFGVSPAETQKQLANLDALEAAYRRQEDLFAEGVPSARTYSQALNDMTLQMAVSGRLADEYIPQLDMINQRLAALSDSTNQIEQDTRTYAEVQGGVITKQDALAAGYGSLQAAVDAFDAVQSRNNATLAETSHWMSVIAGGQQYLNVPSQGFMPVMGPQGPGKEYLSQLATTAGGGFLSPGGAALGDVRDTWQKQWYQQNQADTKAAIRERESADAKAAREWESAAKKTQAEMEAAAKKMASEFESKLGRIAGLTSPSEVTDADIGLSKAGLYQDKADEYLRRLLDATQEDVSKRKSYPGVNIGEAAKAIGMDPGADPHAIGLAFQQAWTSGSLWADRSNIAKFVNLDAVQRDLGQQRQAEVGQRNLLDYLGMDPRIVGAAGYSGILPGRMMSGEAGGMASNPQNWAMTQGGQGANPIGDAMTNGLAAGSMAGLQKFGVDAITIISTAMTGDEAQAQWNTLGTTIAGMMTNSIESAIGQTDFVGVITASVLKNINDELDNTP